jgi:hypothetical protein
MSIIENVFCQRIRVFLRYGVAFHPPEGASEPVFEQVYYPSGSGVARTAIDDARIVNAMGRFAGVSLSFDVNEAGVPVRFRIESVGRCLGNGSFRSCRKLEIQAGRERRRSRFSAD